MTAASARALATDLLPLVRRFSLGEYAIAMGGSYAKGTADAGSDVDLYLFSNAVLPNRQREQITSAFSCEAEEITCWGAAASPINAGTDFRFRGRRVECWLRDSPYVEQAIAECRDGVVRREFVTWTPNGFYNHCCLSDVNVMVALEDPTGMVARWKSQVATYPERLRAAILSRHLASAQFWPDNFHYRSAIERGDVVYVTSIVHQIVHDLIQVLFAVNGVYFPGDKRLEEALAHLAARPSNLSEKLSTLLCLSAPVTKEALHSQRETLCALIAEVKAMSAPSSPR